MSIVMMMMVVFTQALCNCNYCGFGNDVDNYDDDYGNVNDNDNDDYDDEDEDFSAKESC